MPTDRYGYLQVQVRVQVQLQVRAHRGTRTCEISLSESRRHHMHEARPRTTARRLLAGGSVVCYIVLITAGVYPQHIAERCGPVAAGELRAAVGPTHSGLPGACAGACDGLGLGPDRPTEGLGLGPPRGARGALAPGALAWPPSRPATLGRIAARAAPPRATARAGRAPRPPALPPQAPGSPLCVGPTPALELRGCGA